MLETIKVDEVIQHLKWNYNGSLLATATKDKQLRVIDPRSAKVVCVTQGHEGAKSTKIEWLGGNIQPAEYLFSAGAL